MMIHHGSQPYEVAATAAAKVMRTKLEGLIEKGQASAGTVIEQIMSAQPIDRVVLGQNIGYGVEGTSIVAQNLKKPGTAKVHEHALQQMAARVDLPWSYAQSLRESPWGRELLAENLNRQYAHEPKDRRYLMRFARVGGVPELRGFLSDKYRRLDARPITEALITEVKKAGALPYEPVPGEVIAFGLNYETSDFGDGALTVGLFMLRMICTNLASAEDMLRQVHLGKRLAENLEFSEKTYRLDTQTMASAVGDIVGNVLAPATTERYCEAIKAANEDKVDGRQVSARLKAIGLTKAEQTATVEAFNSPNIEEVPAGMSAWRLSNALSWVAGKAENPRRQMELQRMAGGLVKVAA